MQTAKQADLDYLQGVDFETLSIILLDGVLAKYGLGCSTVAKRQRAVCVAETTAKPI
jgi:hypothetical protein